MVAGHKQDKVISDAIADGNIVMMTYSELSFAYLNDKAKAKDGKDTLIMDKMGVVMCDEADMLAFTPQSIMSGGSEPHSFDSMMGKWWSEAIVDIAAVAAQDWLEGQMNENSDIARYANAREQIADLLAKLENGAELSARDLEGLENFIVLSAQLQEDGTIDNITLGELAKQLKKGNLVNITQEELNAVVTQGELLKSLEMSFLLSDMLLRDSLKAMLNAKGGSREFRETVGERAEELIGQKKKEGWRDNLYNAEGILEKKFNTAEAMVDAALALLTWTAGDEYDVSSKGEVLLRKGGELAPLIPRDGMLQAVEIMLGGVSEKGLLFGAGALSLALGTGKYAIRVNERGITRPLDGTEVKAHAVEAIENAAGILGFSGTYASAVKSALGFETEGKGTASPLAGGNYEMSVTFQMESAEKEIAVKDGVITEELILGDEIFDAGTSLKDVLNAAKEQEIQYTLGDMIFQAEKDDGAKADVILENPHENLFELFGSMASNLSNANSQGIVSLANDTLVKLFNLYLGAVSSEAEGETTNPFVSEMAVVSGGEDGIHQIEFIQADSSAERVESIAKSGAARIIVGNVEIIGRGLHIEVYSGLNADGSVELYIVGPEWMYESALTQNIGRVLGGRFKIKGTDTYYDINVHLVTDIQSLDASLLGDGKQGALLKDGDRSAFALYEHLTEHSLETREKKEIEGSGVQQASRVAPEGASSMEKLTEEFSKDHPEIIAEFENVDNGLSKPSGSLTPKGKRLAAAVRLVVAFPDRELLRRLAEMLNFEVEQEGATELNLAKAFIDTFGINNLPLVFSIANALPVISKMLKTDIELLVAGIKAILKAKVPMDDDVWKSLRNIDEEKSKEMAAIVRQVERNAPMAAFIRMATERARANGNIPTNAKALRMLDKHVANYDKLAGALGRMYAPDDKKSDFFGRVSDRLTTLGVLTFKNPSALLGVGGFGATMIFVMLFPVVRAIWGGIWGLIIKPIAFASKGISRANLAIQIQRSSKAFNNTSNPYLKDLNGIVELEDITALTEVLQGGLDSTSRTRLQDTATAVRLIAGADPAVGSRLNDKSQVTDLLTKSVNELIEDSTSATPLPRSIAVQATIAAGVLTAFALGVAPAIVMPIAMAVSFAPMMMNMIKNRSEQQDKLASGSFKDNMVSMFKSMGSTSQDGKKTTDKLGILQIATPFAVGIGTYVLTGGNFSLGLLIGSNISNVLFNWIKIAKSVGDLAHDRKIRSGVLTEALDEIQSIEQTGRLKEVTLAIENIDEQTKLMQDQMSEMQGKKDVTEEEQSAFFNALMGMQQVASNREALVNEKKNLINLEITLPVIKMLRAGMLENNDNLNSERAFREATQLAAVLFGFSVQDGEEIAKVTTGHLRTTMNMPWVQLLELADNEEEFIRAILQGVHDVRYGNKLLKKDAAPAYKFLTDKGVPEDFIKVMHQRAAWRVVDDVLSRRVSPDSTTFVSYYKSRVAQIEDAFALKTKKARVKRLEGLGFVNIDELMIPKVRESILQGLDNPVTVETLSRCSIEAIAKFLLSMERIDSAEDAMQDIISKLVVYMADDFPKLELSPNDMLKMSVYGFGIPATFNALNRVIDSYDVGLKAEEITDKGREALARLRMPAIVQVKGTIGEEGKAQEYAHFMAVIGVDDDGVLVAGEGNSSIKVPASEVANILLPVAIDGSQVANPQSFGASVPYNNMTNIIGWGRPAPTAELGFVPVKDEFSKFGVPATVGEMDLLAADTADIATFIKSVIPSISHKKSRLLASEVARVMRRSGRPSNAEELHKSVNKINGLPYNWAERLALHIFSQVESKDVAVKDRMLQPALPIILSDETGKSGERTLAAEETSKAAAASEGTTPPSGQVGVGKELFKDRIIKVSKAVAPYVTITAISVIIISVGASILGLPAWLSCVISLTAGFEVTFVFDRLVKPRIDRFIDRVVENRPSLRPALTTARAFGNALAIIPAILIFVPVVFSAPTMIDQIASQIYIYESLAIIGAFAYLITKLKKWDLFGPSLLQRFIPLFAGTLLILSSSMSAAFGYADFTQMLPWISLALGGMALSIGTKVESTETTTKAKEAKPSKGIGSLGDHLTRLGALSPDGSASLDSPLMHITQATRWEDIVDANTGRPIAKEEPDVYAHDVYLHFSSDPLKDVAIVLRTALTEQAREELGSPENELKPEAGKLIFVFSDGSNIPLPLSLPLSISHETSKALTQLMDETPEGASADQLAEAITKSFEIILNEFVKSNIAAQPSEAAAQNQGASIFRTPRHLPKAYLESPMIFGFGLTTVGMVELLGIAEVASISPVILPLVLIAGFFMPHIYGSYFDAKQQGSTGLQAAYKTLKGLARGDIYILLVILVSCGLITGSVITASGLVSLPTILVSLALLPLLGFLHRQIDKSVKPIAPTVTELEARLMVIEGRLEKAEAARFDMIKNDYNKAAIDEISLLFEDIFRDFGRTPENKRVNLKTLHSYLQEDNRFTVTSSIIKLAYLLYTDMPEDEIAAFVQEHDLAGYYEIYSFKPIIEAIHRALLKEEKAIGIPAVESRLSATTSTITLESLLTELKQK